MNLKGLATGSVYCGVSTHICLKPAAHHDGWCTVGGREQFLGSLEIYLLFRGGPAKTRSL